MPHRKSENIYIVTPTFNSVETLERTIKSVVYQKGTFNLHYHVQDGGSSDGTIEILKKWRQIIKDCNFYCNSIEFTYISEPDSGMYDAIFKGFSRILPSFDVWMGWINSDDILLPDTFQFLSDVHHSYGDTVSWITGMQAVNMVSTGIKMHDIHYSSSLIAQGICDGTNWWFIQQEGTFWRKRLWDRVDLERHFIHFRYAGDWSLWLRLAQSGAILFQARMPLGMFHSRPGQLSQLHSGDYSCEIESVIPLKNREEYVYTMVDQEFQIHHLERFYNFNAIVMSSSLVTLLGPKSCFPSIQAIKPLD